MHNKTKLGTKRMIMESEIEAALEEVKDWLTSLSTEPWNQKYYDNVIEAIGQLERMADEIQDDSECSDSMQILDFSD